MKYRDRVDAAMMLPRVNWRQAKNERHARTSPATADPDLVGAGAVKGNGSHGSAAKPHKRRAEYSKR